MKILFVTAEAHPLVKTGGLADVCGSLPLELQRIGHDVRLALPAYPAALARARDLTCVGALDVPCAPAPVRILLGTMPDAQVPLYLIDSPAHFDREGTPYGDERGQDWSDNAERFAVFCRAVTGMAMGRVELGWRPDVVHCHDWHTGLVPALLQQEPATTRPASIFTIHNLAYQGLFSFSKFQDLHLPTGLWRPDGLEFHGKMSFIKGGLVFSDWLTTVSPTYADEICTPRLGCGLDDLLRQRRDRLCGILNGANYEEWDPGNDPFIARPYTARSIESKAENKRHLQESLGLERDEESPLIASVGRLVEQKGIDLMVEAMSELMERPVQLVVMGNGERRFGSALEDAARQNRGRLAVHVGYTEELAHQVEAGADMFLMPSRFEPCGLTQLYSMRYGTIPIVRRTGGLADTVVDADADNVAAGRANGFVFDEPTQPELLRAVDRAIECFAEAPATWRQIATTGMAQEYSWTRSAGRYRELYHGAVADRPA
ncbi:MAG: glycogen synthase GlgA [Planctomycetes bacterium]|nr:glycogen synthase GlgA [Planctomycetota bacterium]